MEERIASTENALCFVLKLKAALIKLNVKRKTEYTFLKPVQTQSIKHALESDCIL